ncbi:MAG TPA: TIGR03435 family protein [Bryobacteraceae bacterium]|nr:TIGR03435 family protein [Bryobacteraceae bacterium]
MVRILAAALLPLIAFCQAFQSVDLGPAPSADSWVSVGLLPDGHVECHNVTLRQLIAAAYDVDAELVTGGPGWLDTERFVLSAKTEPTSRTNLLKLVQNLVGSRFQLTLGNRLETSPVYKLTVAKGGPKLSPSAGSDKGCTRADGPPAQIHLACHNFTMADLADFLPRAAGGYVQLDVLDQTRLTGAFDFPLDWMARGAYDAAVAKQSAGGPKDPLAVSIFEAVGKLGLLLEKSELSKTAYTVEKAEHLARTARTSEPASLTADQMAAVDKYVADEMGREHIPGLAVGIYHRGQILLAKGYGLANVELNVPVKAETIFQSGSVGKQFVSAAVMMLVEEGKVALDDSITKYFPDAPETWKPILIKNLLSHTSGLAEYESPERTGPKGPFYMRLDYSEDEMVKRIEEMPIEAKPGEVWNYRNTNYVLLGVMIHKLTGKFYADFLEQRIFHPWYMNATRLISEADIIPNRSSGYTQSRGKLHNQEWVSPTFNSTADGTLYFNVLDLAKWDEALYGTSLLQQSSLDRIWTVFPLNDGNPNPAHYGFGWGISAVNGHKIIEHGGAWQGFTCQISRYVDDGLTVVVLTNLAGARPGVIAQAVAALVNPSLKPPPPKQRTEVTINPKLLDGYTGKYELAPGFIITVTREGDHLNTQATGQGTVPIFAESERDFFVKTFDAQITFVTDSSGRATEIVLHQNGDHHAKRIE